jgi:hypothetical protein
MENQRIKELISRFNSGEASDPEKKELEKLLEAGMIALEDFRDLPSLESQIGDLETPLPSEELDERFYHMLALEKGKGRSSWKQFFSWPELAPKLALASVMVILGAAAGYFLSPSTAGPHPDQIATLRLQVTDLREMIMLTLLEKESASDRLKAVSLTEQMGEASRKVTNALIQTLNQDENVNVRLAALDALKPYVRDSHVRESLIRSISKQESPLVQISMAELMGAMQEKSAVKEFEKIVSSDKTPAAVKKKIRESIQALI